MSRLRRAIFFLVSITSWCSVISQWLIERFDDDEAFFLIGLEGRLLQYLFVKVRKRFEWYVWCPYALFLTSFHSVFSIDDAESQTKTTHGDEQSTRATSEEIRRRTDIGSSAGNRRKQSEVHRSGRSTWSSVEIEENGWIHSSFETAAELESTRGLGRRCRGCHLLEWRSTDWNLFVRDMSDRDSRRRTLFSLVSLQRRLSWRTPIPLAQVIWRFLCLFPLNTPMPWRITPLFWKPLVAVMSRRSNWRRRTRSSPIISRNRLFPLRSSSERTCPIRSIRTTRFSTSLSDRLLNISRWIRQPPIRSSNGSQSAMKRKAHSTWPSTLKAKKLARKFLVESSVAYRRVGNANRKVRWRSARVIFKANGNVKGRRRARMPHKRRSRNITKVSLFKLNNRFFPTSNWRMKCRNSLKKYHRSLFWSLRSDNKSVFETIRLKQKKNNMILECCRWDWEICNHWNGQLKCHGNENVSLGFAEKSPESVPCRWSSLGTNFDSRDRNCWWIGHCRWCWWITGHFFPSIGVVAVAPLVAVH